MLNVRVSSDPYAWLKPIFLRLRAHPAFSQFAPSHQFDQLVQAVERENASEAAQMREWSVAVQHALLNHLASAVKQEAIPELKHAIPLRVRIRRLLNASIQAVIHSAAPAHSMRSSGGTQWGATARGRGRTAACRMGAACPRNDREVQNES